LEYATGIHRLKIDIGALPQATYIAVVRVNGVPISFRMSVL
jgi:hypothetical protein